MTLNKNHNYAYTSTAAPNSHIFWSIMFSYISKKSYNWSIKGPLREKSLHFLCLSSTLRIVSHRGPFLWHWQGCGSGFVRIRLFFKGRIWICLFLMVAPEPDSDPSHSSRIPIHAFIYPDNISLILTFT